MAKIGIITYHFAGNYGAVLQCYALNEYLNTYGHDVKVINCITPKQGDNNSMYRKNSNLKSILKNILLLPFHKSRKIRFQRFNQFRNNNLKLTQLVESVDELKNIIEIEKFDYIISGSDQVFNPNIYDFEPTFLYPFKTRSKKIGYAVSIGKATSEQLNEYSEWIKDFSCISVREESAAERLSLFSKEITTVIDPVFLLNKLQWESICTKKTKHYVLGYYINTKYRDQCLKISKKIAKQLNLELIIVDARISKAVFYNTVISHAGPKEFVELVMNADFICTDSFHGTSFSILLEKPFVCFEPRKKSLDTRKTNLCKNIGLENHICYLDDSINICLETINYESVKKYLSIHIDASKEFLKKNII